jgi:hypothetical protein
MKTARRRSRTATPSISEKAMHSMANMARPGVVLLRGQGGKPGTVCPLTQHRAQGTNLKEVRRGMSQRDTMRGSSTMRASRTMSSCNSRTCPEQTSSRDTTRGMLRDMSLRCHSMSHMSGSTKLRSKSLNSTSQTSRMRNCTSSNNSHDPQATRGGEGNEAVTTIEHRNSNIKSQSSSSLPRIESTRSNTLKTLTLFQLTSLTLPMMIR